ncbi:MAG: hypothetical protein ACJ8AT_39130 [Hyalangium sp.]|uniref:hypothetical protein n=1 Tax=Hyalangium sp. TaxID=2028555 RepID=UPI00389A8D62
MTRSRDNFTKEFIEHGPAFRVLPGNVGWIHLGRLKAAQVPEVFAQLKDTRALVLDLQAGRDEVLEAALQLLEKPLPPSTPSPSR